MRKLLFALAPGLVALAIGVYVGYQRQQPDDANPSQARLTDIVLPDIEGVTQSGEQWLGKLVLVNHWAPWCPPCVAEIPLLIETQKTFASRGFQVIGVAHDKAEATRLFSDQIGIDYPSLVVDRGGQEMMIRQGNPNGAALPYSVMFDQSGVIVFSHLGILKADQLTTAIQEHL